MDENLRHQLREIDQALAALNEIIAVRHEYVSLLAKVGSFERALAGLDALVNAARRLQTQRDSLAATVAGKVRGGP
jgi:hypothetical protein